MSESKRNILVIFLIFGLVVVFWSGKFANLWQGKITKPAVQQTENIKGVEVKKVNVSLTIENSERISTYSANVEEGKSVLDVLKELSSKSGFNVSVKEYSGLGEMVEEIDGVKSGKDNKFWGYYINDVYADVGAGEKKVEEGDRILWKLEASKW